MKDKSPIRNRKLVGRIVDQRKRRQYQSALAEHLEHVNAIKTHAAASESDELALRGRRVLIAEDSYEQARELADLLRSMRIEVVGPFPRAREALKYLEHDRVDAAVLDIFLAEGNALGLAKALCETHTPFAFLTGYQQEVIPAEFRDAPYYCKPCSSEEIASFLRSVFQ